MPQCVAMETENNVTTSDNKRNSEEEEDVMLRTEHEGNEEEPNPSPTMYHDTVLSHDIQQEDRVESAGDKPPCQHEDGPEEAGLREDCRLCSPETLLQGTVDRLQMVMETDRWRETETGEYKIKGDLLCKNQV